MKTTKQILENLKNERELKKRTLTTYKQSIKQFEDSTNTTIHESIQLHEKEQRQGILWKESTLKQTLLTYRKHLYKKYKHTAAKTYWSKIISLFHYEEIEIGRLEPVKTPKNNLVFDDDVPSQDELKIAVNCLDKPVIKTLTTLISSGGFSPVDLWKIDLRYYIKKTSKYHNYNQHKDIPRAIREMLQYDDIIIAFEGNRVKTGVQYIGFVSPESITNLNHYLLSREDTLTLDSKLIKESRNHIGYLFSVINDKLNMGYRQDGRARFSMQNLRSYHATQLSKAGMNEAKINILEGRENNSIVNKHYIRVDRESLMNEYIKCLPYLVVEDINKVKTELENTQEELKIVQEENKELKMNFNSVWDKLNSMDERQRALEKLQKK